MSALTLVSVVLLGSFLLTGLIRLVALRTAVLDIPNQRSSHTSPTPRGGGLAIVSAFLFGVGGLLFLAPAEAPVFFIWLLISSLLVAGVGLWDDLRQLSASRRILVHFLAAILLLWGLGGENPQLADSWLLGIWRLPASVLLVLAEVWALNLFNFMDGIDGLASGEAGFVAGSAALLLAWQDQETAALLNLMLTVACLGFLLWNWPPAKIFMGDVGSGFLGFVLGALTLWTSIFNHFLPVGCWLILSGVFLVDATLTLLRRMLRRERWYDAHRSHAYQQAALLVGSHRTVTMSVLAINIFWLLPLSALCVIVPEFEWPLLIMAYTPLIILAVKFNAGGATRS